MRKKFEPQLVLGCTSIANVQIPTKSRDEFPPFLRAMQHIFLDKELSSLVFNLLETSICTKQPTGRQGMDLWTLFVLAEARLCLNTDYDDLHYRSNYDLLLRQILGVHDGILVLRTKYEVVRGREFDLQVIKDNVKLLDEKTLREINKVIVRAGHHLVQKKEPEALRILVLRTKYAVKIDTFVTEANVHFPTDYFVLRTKYKYNLLWDSGRKCLDVLGHLMETDTAYCTGWRKIEYWRKHMKNNMLKLSRTTADKSKNRGERIKKASDEYLHTARSLSVKLSNVKQLNSLDFVEGVMFKQLA